MSDSIYLRIKLEKNFFDIETSKFLFEVIKEGCNRSIAITIVERDSMESRVGESGLLYSSIKQGLIAQKPDECVLSLSSSYNFLLVNPLVGRDFDDEVIEYCPDPLNARLTNLQNLFKFIFDQDIVKEMEAIFTLDYDIEELEMLDVGIDDFAVEVENFIKHESVLGICEVGCNVIWKKQNTGDGSMC